MREAAARAQCQNQLKQIALALHHHHDTHRCFPSGTVRAADLLPDKRLSWLASILPFVEQDALHKQLKPSQPWDAHENQAIRTALSLYVCPAHPGWNASSTQFETHYVGLAGVGRDAALIDKQNPLAGFFGFERRITLKDISDGTSSTAAVVETGTDNGPWAAGGQTTLRGLDPAITEYIHENGPFGMKHKTDTFFRTNPVLANTAFADGSVRSVPSDLAASVIRALSTIAGGEAVATEF
ncbi:MAG: DUF1559 domain-containing protein [Gemmataceae bacterium]|nr:DUF1559 domain-containing protein [Gemmataceae bacterium]